MMHASSAVCRPKSVNTKIGYHYVYYLLRDKVLLLSTGSIICRPVLL